MASPGAEESSPIRHESRYGNRINPNDAQIESLMRLPGLGAGRAGAIVAFRESFEKNNGNSRAFENCNDLLKVSGIGPKTVQNMSEWLDLE